MLHSTGIPHNLNHLWKRLTTAHILVYPDFSNPIILYTDASGDSIGFSLTQIQKSQERAIAYGR